MTSENKKTETMVERVDDSWKFADIAKKRPPKGWENFFKESMSNLEHVDKFFEKEKILSGQFYPTKNNVFRAFECCPLSSVEVVIIGQDPYHGLHQDGIRCQAQGLSFSVASDDATPKSLINVIKELKDNYPNTKVHGAGNLINWALQGVLLLNTALTVAPGEPESHLKREIWDGFIVKLLRCLAENRPGIIYVMWGAKAQAFSSKLDPKAVSLIAGHPSPMNRTGNFIGCKHFLEINKILKDKKKKEIDWTIY